METTTALKREAHITFILVSIGKVPLEFYSRYFNPFKILQQTKPNNDHKNNQQQMPLIRMYCLCCCD